MPARALPASPGFPPAKDLIKTHIAPTGASLVPNAQLPELVNGENALINNCCETPAAINKLTPEPKPHLLITSSIYSTINPPRINCPIRITSIPLNNTGVKVGSGDKPPIN